VGGCAWAGGEEDGYRFNIMSVEIKERASGAQKHLQGACQGQTSLVLSPGKGSTKVSCK